MEKEIKTLADIKAGQVYTIVAPNIEATITGAYKCGIYPDGHAVLVYIDESREDVMLTHEEARDVIAKGKESFFPVVSAIQSKRAAA